jgi:two-component system, OmpR family, response regulator
MASVLLVDDEVRFARALGQGLTDHGFDVCLAHDGYDGYRLAKESQYDLVVLDIMLPRLSGVEVCRRLRAEDVGTPILMLTARDAVADETDALETGADDYLRKPFSFAVLVARCRALVRRGDAGAGPSSSSVTSCWTPPDGSRVAARCRSTSAGGRRRCSST